MDQAAQKNADLYDPTHDEVLSIEVEIEGETARRVRDFAQRFGYGSYALAIVALVHTSLDSLS